MSSRGPALTRHTVDPCPKCGQRHDFALAARPRPEGVLVFGGAPTRTIDFICPETGEPFTDEVVAPAGDTELVPVDPSQRGRAEPPTAPMPSGDGEFEEWIKDSRRMATEFCKTMAATATGLVPVYFAVLKYIGFEKTTTGFAANAAIVPPVLFVVAALLFVLALRPRLRAITPAQFPRFRSERLLAMNRLLVAGVAIYAIGVVLAIIVFFALLR